MEPAHPKEDDEANQRRFKAEVWREQVELPGGRVEDGLQNSGRTLQILFVERLMIKHGSFQGSQRLLWATKA